MSKFFMMAKIVEKENRKVGDCPESKKTKDETLQNVMDSAAFSALVKEKMNPSPKLKKEVEELEMKLEKGKSQSTLFLILSSDKRRRCPD